MPPVSLSQLIQQLNDREQRLLASLLRRMPVAVDRNADYDRQLTLGERVADRVATFGGSWTFIFSFLFAMAIWMAWNTLGRGHFDPYPFILLNLVLSCLAALQAPVIMMSQNRQNDKDRFDAHHDYEVNMKAEMEIMALHVKIDALREETLQELVVLQRRQMELLERLTRRQDES